MAPFQSHNWIPRWWIPPSYNPLTWDCDPLQGGQSTTALRDSLLRWALWDVVPPTCRHLGSHEISWCQRWQHPNLVEYHDLTKSPKNWVPISHLILIQEGETAGVSWLRSQFGNHCIYSFSGRKHYWISELGAFLWILQAYDCTEIGI